MGAQPSQDVGDTIDREATGDALHALCGIRPSTAIVRLLLRETGHELDDTLSRDQLEAIARVYCDELEELVGPELVERRDAVQRFAFGDGPVGIGVRRSDQGLKVRTVEGEAADVGVQLGFIVVECQGEPIPALMHQRNFGRIVAKSPRPLVLGFKDPAEAPNPWTTYFFLLALCSADTTLPPHRRLPYCEDDIDVLNNIEDE